MGMSHSRKKKLVHASYLVKDIRKWDSNPAPAGDLSFRAVISKISLYLLREIYSVITRFPGMVSM